MGAGVGLSTRGRNRSRNATWSFVLALVGALLGITGVPLLCSIAAIVLGARARREIRADPELRGAGMAIAGIVIGAVGLVFYAALIVSLRVWGKNALI